MCSPHILWQGATRRGLIRACPLNSFKAISKRMWNWFNFFSFVSICRQFYAWFPALRIRLSASVSVNHLRNPYPRCRSVAPLPFPYRVPNGYGKNITRSQLNGWTDTANLRQRRTLFLRKLRSSYIRNSHGLTFKGAAAPRLVVLCTLVMLANAKFWSFYSKTWYSKYSKWLPPVDFWQL